MKNVKKLLLSLSAGAMLVLPLGLGTVAHAAQVQPLECSNGDTGSTEACDLGIDKQVSVDGGKTFVEADTAAAAAQTTVGSTVIWQITVSNNSEEGFTPTGTVTVDDVLPSSGVSYVSSSATAGAYNNTTGTWALPLTSIIDSESTSTLPATLTITTTSTSTGLFENTATLSTYNLCGSDCGNVAYSDSNPDNDSNSAWVDPSAPPKVLGASTTLPDTGGGVAPSILAGGLLAATAGVVLASRRQSKETKS